MRRHDPGRDAEPQARYRREAAAQAQHSEQRAEDAQCQDRAASVRFPMAPLLASDFKRSIAMATPPGVTVQRRAALRTMGQISGTLALAAQRRGRRRWDFLHVLGRRLTIE